MSDVCHDDESKRTPIETIVITSDGLLRAAASSPVSYLELIHGHDLRARVISFETRTSLEDSDRVDAVRQRLGAKGIEWKPLRSHERFTVAGTILDSVAGTIVAVRMARARPVHVVHARSYLPGIIGYVATLFCGARLVFDMGGFLPEERVEQQRFRPQGMFYRVSKRCERFLLDVADHVVVMTDSAKAILRDREANARLLARRRVRETPISVIPQCTDVERFRPAIEDSELKSAAGLSHRMVIGNVGAADRRYMLPEMFRFAFHVKSHRPETRFVYLTQDSEAPVRAAAREAGLVDDDVLVRAIDPLDVPRWLSLFRLGVFFLRPSYAAKASSHPELAEFLACGVPVVTNTGVGDVDAVFGDRRPGVLVPGLTENDLAVAARRALALLDGDTVADNVVEACRSTATERFALTDGAESCLAIYHRLAHSPPAETQPSIVAEVG